MHAFRPLLSDSGLPHTFWNVARPLAAMLYFGLRRVPAPLLDRDTSRVALISRYVPIPLSNHKTTRAALIFHHPPQLNFSPYLYVSRIDFF